MLQRPANRRRHAVRTDGLRMTMEPIVLPDEHEITEILKKLYDHEIMINHFIPLIAAEGRRVMDADQVAGLVLETYASVKPLMHIANVRLDIVDFRLIVLALCDGCEKEFIKQAQRALLEMIRLERLVFGLPPEEVQ